MAVTKIKLWEFYRYCHINKSTKLIAIDLVTVLAFLVIFIDFTVSFPLSNKLWENHT